VDLAALERRGLLSPHYKHHQGDVESKKRYVAHALDYRAALEAAHAHASTAWVGIFEDHLILTTSPAAASQRIRAAMRQLPPSADALYLEWCWDTCNAARFHPELPDISLPHEPFCSAAILYSKTGAAKLIQQLVPVYTSVDNMISTACKARALRCFKLRQPVFAQDLMWGSSLDPLKTRTHFHSIYRFFNAGALCSDIRHIQIQPSMWWAGLVKGYRNRQIRHPEDSPTITVHYASCRPLPSLRTTDVLSGLALTLAVDWLVPGVEYRACVDVTDPVTFQVRSSEVATFAVPPGERALQVDVPLTGGLLAQAVAWRATSRVVTVYVQDAFPGLTFEDALLAKFVLSDSVLYNMLMTCSLIQLSPAAELDPKPLGSKPNAPSAPAGSGAGDCELAENQEGSNEADNAHNEADNAHNEADNAHLPIGDSIAILLVGMTRPVTSAVSLGTLQEHVCTSVWIYM
jgi:hypothetical protein